jgi:hypothetical protein
MTCRACIHWDRYKGGSAELGDCRRYPPRINDLLLARVLPGLSTPLSDHDEVERDLYVASAFPITHESSACGEYDSAVPL